MKKDREFSLSFSGLRKRKLIKEKRGGFLCGGVHRGGGGKLGERAASFFAEEDAEPTADLVKGHKDRIFF